jgi:hypothetical protein
MHTEEQTVLQEQNSPCLCQQQLISVTAVSACYCSCSSACMDVQCGNALVTACCCADYYVDDYASYKLTACVASTSGSTECSKRALRTVEKCSRHRDAKYRDAAAALTAAQSTALTNTHGSLFAPV